ncbi:hypothetical protein [Acetivibrio ethanolgignens]|uniref:Uncharacterized protein n=1 Tax=Acetivibrio ethanolgignens TaxID=290052 RepID=A0A0V8QFR8_9FIRM|nr:hypothetical protein [Acetivibrio ethanolgignens]KSV59451.1 hypothetical protein ASU35_08985 [Acetivibrio ethanolgignens]
MIQCRERKFENEEVEQKNKISFSVQEKKFRLFCYDLIFAVPVFFHLLGAAFRFGGWYKELPEQVQQYVLLGCGVIVFFAALYYVCLICFLLSIIRKVIKRNIYI